MDKLNKIKKEIETVVKENFRLYGGNIESFGLGYFVATYPKLAAQSKLRWEVARHLQGFTAEQKIHETISWLGPETVVASLKSYYVKEIKIVCGTDNNDHSFAARSSKRYKLMITAAEKCLTEIQNINKKETKTCSK